MARVDGLASGLNTSAIIKSILDVERIPILRLQGQIKQATDRKTAYLGISARLLSAKSFATQLGKPSLFTGTQVASSNPASLLATAKTGFSLTGAFQFTVKQLATADQYVSQGFASKTATLSAGTATIEIGNGSVKRTTELATLNGGDGVALGNIRVTDKSGNSATIDLTGALTVDDVMNSINNASNLSVTASLNASGQGIQLTDTSGGAGSLTVAEVNGGTTATDLKLLGTTGGAVLGAASDLVYLTGNTQLAQLNDGRGVRLNPSTDIQITLSDGSTNVSVDLGNASTIQQVIDAIEAADPSLQADIAAGGDGLVISDTLAGGNALVINDAFGGGAATDLGIATSVAKQSVAGQTTGRNVLAGLNTVLLSSLNGGAGVTLGQINITDRSGNAATVDLSGAQTLQDVIQAINGNGTAQVVAGYNAGGSGLKIVDTSGGVGNLIINENGSTTAAELGIENGAGVAKNTFEGRNTQFQYVTVNTRLETMNGGKGIGQGDIRITNKNGDSFNVSLAQNEQTLTEVINDINGATGGTVVASINANGDGLLLTDTTGGSGQFRVEDVNGTTAKDLNILKSSTGSTIDGSFEYTVTINAGDTLEDLNTRINALNANFTSTILNSGAGSTPYRLNLISDLTGSNGRLTFDLSSVGLNMTQSASGQDAVVLYGNTTPGNTPLQIRSSSNTIEDILPNLDVTLLSAGPSPVTVTANNDYAAVVDQVQGMVDAVNALLDATDDMTSFNAETFESGLLFGDTTVRNVEQALFRQFSSRITGLSGNIRSMADVGVRVTQNGRFTFDSGKLEQQLQTNPDAVMEFFTKRETTGTGSDLTIKDIGFATVLEAYITDTTDQFDGTLTKRVEGFDTLIEDYNKQIEAKNDSIASLEERLTQQFANLEIFISSSNNTMARLQQSLLPIKNNK